MVALTRPFSRETACSNSAETGAGRGLEAGSEGPFWREAGASPVVAGAVGTAFWRAVAGGGDGFGMIISQSSKTPSDRRAAKNKRFSINSLWDCVDAATVKRVASGKTLDRKPGAARQTVLSNGFESVNRAGRLEPASSGQKRRKNSLVRGQNPDRGVCASSHRRGLARVARDIAAR